MPNRRDYSYARNGNMSEVYNGQSYYYPGLIANAERGWRLATDYSRAKPLGSWLPPTNYSMEEVVEHAPKGVRSVTYPGGGGIPFTHSGYLYGIGSVATLLSYPNQEVSELFPDGLVDKALTKARLQIKSQDVNLGVAFAERRKTASLVLNTAKRLAGAFTDLKRGNLRKAAARFGIRDPKKGSKDLAEQWLELQYGWKPLLQDVHGAVKALEGRDSSDWIVTAKGSASVERKGIGRHNPGDSFNAQYAHKDFHGAFCRIDVVPGNSAVATAASLGLLNPAAVAWEILPFSFIVDWFVPVGDYINQFDALAGWDLKGYSMTTFSRTHWKWYGINWPYDPPDVTNDTQNTWVAVRNRVALNRQIGSSVPFPTFPNVKDPVSASHVANALALLRQAFR